MPITQTNLHIGYVMGQIQANMIGLQRDVNSNAQTHRAMALAQSPDLKTLQSFITDSITQYNRRLKWFDDWVANNQKQVDLANQLTKMQWSMSDLTTIQEGIRSGVNTFSQSKMEDYGGIVTACDQLILDVNDPESLWPQ